MSGVVHTIGDTLLIVVCDDMFAELSNGVIEIMIVVFMISLSVGMCALTVHGDESNSGGMCALTIHGGEEIIDVVTVRFVNKPFGIVIV